jgi:hypothetical protein
VAADILGPDPVPWIRLARSSDVDQQQQARIPDVRLRGGCEVAALSHYLSVHAKSCVKESSLSRGPFYIRKDVSHQFFGPLDRGLSEAAMSIASRCGFQRSDFVSRFFDECPPGSLFVYCGWGDIRLSFRCAATGEMLTVGTPGFPYCLGAMTQEEFEKGADERKLDDEAKQLILAAGASLEDAGTYEVPNESDVKGNLSRIFSNIPRGNSVVSLAVDEKYLGRDGDLKIRSEAVRYNHWLREVAARYGVRVFSIEDYIERDEERERTDHYDRIVYFRLAEAIVRFALGRNRAVPRLE